jgi:hypothetical protein
MRDVCISQILHTQPEVSPSVTQTTSQVSRRGRIGTFLGPCHRSGKAGSFAVSCERVGRALWSLLGEGYGFSRGAWRMVSLADRNFFRHTRLLYGCMWRDCCVAQVGCTPLTEGVASFIIDGLRVFGLSAERRWEGDV